ncbi:MAG: tRNA pseudouridine(38-40) synthase TruA [Enterobacterales bacterium]|nr:tRNA pseudouridine(38-40) synthase TruA [Enterobacterales bacterium]
MGIEYLGSQYHGWQRQSHATNIQSTLEQVLSKVCDEAIEVTCAGRTDAGVHATAQYVHFDCHKARPTKAFLKGANTLLPNDISVFSAEIVPSDFHARFSAKFRTYLYIINNTAEIRALANGRVTQFEYPLNETLMHEAAQALLGEQNFSAFRSAHCQSHSVHRFVREVSVRREQELLLIQITANAFLHHMVRNIVGSLIDIGQEKKSVNWLTELLVGEDRTQAGITAPPEGLYLIGVEYPENTNTTTRLRYPWLMSSS